MAKISFLGAGSTVFAKNVLGDCLHVPALRDAEIALIDIDADRLHVSETMLKNVNRTLGAAADIRAYLADDAAEGLRGADYVVNAIQVGGYEPATVTDFEIPKKYGLRQTIADTLGIGGIFRALRTIPVMLDYCRIMEEVAPDALLLNYVNPMAMICWALGQTKVRFVGLCHGVQTTMDLISGYVDVPKDEIDYLCAGINHMGLSLIHISEPTRPY